VVQLLIMQFQNLLKTDRYTLPWQRLLSDVAMATNFVVRFATNPAVDDVRMCTEVTISGVNYSL